LLADTPEAFAGASIRLFQDSALRNRLRLNARGFVERYYRWDDCAAAQLLLYQRLRAREAISRLRAGQIVS
jgi:glycosyltransferase involved in cell wall biosynthesis